MTAQGCAVILIMNKKQKLAIIASLMLTGMMYPIFQYLVGVLGERIGWYLGLAIYLSFLAKKTGKIWWSIIAHVLGGIIMIIKLGTLGKEQMYA